MNFIRHFFRRKIKLDGRSQSIPFDHSGQMAFDLSDLYLLAEHNTEYSIQLLELFLSNAEKGLKQLQIACELHNWNQASAIAHKLIPGCNQLHISQLVAILQQIEAQTSNKPDALSLKALSNQAMYSFYQVKKMIGAELGKLKELPPPNLAEGR